MCHRWVFHRTPCGIMTGIIGDQRIGEKDRTGGCGIALTGIGDQWLTGITLTGITARRARPSLTHPCPGTPLSLYC